MKGVFGLFLLLLSFSLYAQTAEEQAVLLPIKQLFLGMQNKDTNMIKAQMHKNTWYFYTYRYNKNGELKIDTSTLKNFTTSIGNLNEQQIEEKIFKPIVKIDEPLATVWVDYEFWLNNKLSHIGVDAFTLVKIGNEWKITGIVDTRKKK
jgi:hypothetical protein